MPSGTSRRLAGVVVVVAGHRLQRGRGIRHRTGHRSDVIHALLSGKADREMRDQPEGRLQPDHAAIGGRKPDRAALVAAERDVHLARRQRRAGARRRPTGDPRRIMRVQRPAVVAHEPVHHVLADDLAAGRQHPRHDGRVNVGDEALHGLRREHLRDAGDADMVLEADGLASQQLRFAHRRWRISRATPGNDLQPATGGSPAHAPGTAAPAPPRQHATERTCPDPASRR